MPTIFTLLHTKDTFSFVLSISDCKASTCTFCVLTASCRWNQIFETLINCIITQTPFAIILERFDVTYSLRFVESFI